MTTPKHLPPVPGDPTLTIVHHDTGELNPAGLRDFARAARCGANICRWIAEQLDAISHRNEQMARETDEENWG